MMWTLTMESEAGIFREGGGGGLLVEAMLGWRNGGIQGLLVDMKIGR